MQQQASLKHISTTLQYFPKEALEAHRRSLEPAIDAETEARWRKTTVNLVRDVITRLKLPHWVFETAVVYVHRFFMSRSLKANDRFLVIAAAVLLASKVQESPRPIDDVARAAFEAKHANKKAAWQHPNEKAAALSDFKAGMLMAEQAILFSLNFNLVVPASLNVLRDVTQELGLQPPVDPANVPEGMGVEEAQGRLKLYKATLQILQDSFKTSICLQHAPTTVASVALLMAAKLLRKNLYSGGGAGKPLPPCIEFLLSPQGLEWLQSKDIQPAQAQDIEAQLEVLYAPAPSGKPPQQQQQQPAALAQQPGPAAAPAPAQQQPGQATSSVAAQEEEEAQPSTSKQQSVLAAPRTPPAHSLPSQTEGSPEEGEVVGDDAGYSGMGMGGTTPQQDAPLARGQGQPQPGPSSDAGGMEASSSVLEGAAAGHSEGRAQQQGTDGRQEQQRQQHAGGGGALGKRRAPDSPAASEGELPPEAKAQRVEQQQQHTPVLTGTA